MMLSTAWWSMVNYRGICIPPTSFGNVCSDDLFCEKEQALFDFYERSANRYEIVLDVGANIGVHTIMMARNRWHVTSFEPDPWHFEMLCANVERNGYAELCSLRNQALSDHSGTAQFVRVKGNTTGSHLKGDKSPYGELEEFPVQVVDCRQLFRWADFAKIDCEGHEARLLTTVPAHCECEFMVEVGSERNAEAIYKHFDGRRMFAQHLGWGPVMKLGDMPTHHSHGALFIGNDL